MKTKRILISRSCPECSHHQSLMGETLCEETLSELYMALDGQELTKSTVGSAIERRIETKDTTGILRSLQRMAPKPIPSANLVYFLRKVLQESRSDEVDLFANKQLSIMSICSVSICDFCGGEICLRCGESDWHRGRTCIEYLEVKLSFLSKDDAEYESLSWKVANGKNCPKCFLLITKDDDGSCNQIRCSNCGYVFCWGCLREWSSDCGYYRCAIENDQDHSTGGSSDSNSKRSKKIPNSQRAEAGIPDVTKLPSFSPR